MVGRLGQFDGVADWPAVQPLWCKHITAVSDGRLNGAHARIVLPIELHTKKLTPVRYGEPTLQIW